MSEHFPYEEMVNTQCSEAILKKCFAMIGDLMQGYEPFGQAASSYEDTGDPEMVALGIRTFLSVPANIGMLKAIGKQTFDTIVTLGIVVERGHWNSKRPLWLRLKKELKKADSRTYNVIMGKVNQELLKAKKEKYPHEGTEKVKDLGGC